MDKGKGIRKYSMPKQAFRCGRFTVQRAIVFGLKLLAWVGIFIGILSWFVLVLGSTRIVPALASLKISPLCMLAMVVFSILVAVFVGFLDHTIPEAPEGSFLNPQSPHENPLLPDASLLVRASSSSAAQPAELLRAARETTEQKPEELLRAAE